MSKENKKQNTEAMHHDNMLCAVLSKEMHGYIDLIKYTEQQMFKICGIPKKIIENEKSKKKWLIKIKCLIGKLNKNFKRKRRMKF
jgi:hypothetical protein